MLQRIEMKRAGAVAFQAADKVTHEDYANTLIPELERAIQDYGKARLLYVLSDRFEGFTPQALFDDACFGAKHFKDFDRVAFVSDNRLIAGAVRMFAPLIPGEVRVFPLKDREVAKTWIDEADAEMP